MKAAKLLQKLEAEADFAFERERRMELVRFNVKQPPTKAEQNRDQLLRLRKQTSEILNELELAQQVEAENARYVEARSQQRKANLTTAEKKAQAEETRRGQILFSRIIPENHPDWREQEGPNAEFYRLQYNPTNGSKPKNR